MYKVELNGDCIIAGYTHVECVKTSRFYGENDIFLWFKLHALTQNMEIIMPEQQAEKNIALLRNLYEEVFENGDLSGYKIFFDKNIQGNYPPSWNIVYGSSNTQEIDAAWKAFKFKNVLTKDVFANDPKGEKIVVRWSCEGTHVLDFYGVKAENKPFYLTGMTIYRFSPEGKIAEVWQSWDMFGLLLQIGGLQMNENQLVNG